MSQITLLTTSDSLDALWANVGPSLQPIAPGIVLMKGALSHDQQLWLATYAVGNFERMNPNLLETTTEGKRTASADTRRARVYDAVARFEQTDYIQALCQALVKRAQSIDKELPDMTPTHLLLLYYADAQGMTMHRDDDPNDGDNDHPIVSLSLGNSCEFVYKIPCKPYTTITLESGDVLIWGGPSRMLLHGVNKINMDTTPSFLPIQNARINFTYRDAPTVLGQEEQFKYPAQVINVANSAT